MEFEQRRKQDERGKTLPNGKSLGQEVPTRGIQGLGPPKSDDIYTMMAAASDVTVSDSGGWTDKIKSWLPGRQTHLELPPPTEEATERVAAFTEKHFVREAPRFGSLIEDETRDNTFTHWHSAAKTRTSELDGHLPPGTERMSVTEHDGLVELDTFLERAAGELSDADNTETRRLGERAQQLRDGLTYIGEKELDEAAGGIADVWKSYLQEDPKHQLCVPQGIIGADDPAVKKSPELVFGRVMGHFSEAELAAYGKRIVTSVADLPRRADPGSTKIVLLDDWSKSGTQMDRGYSRVLGETVRNPGLRGSVEVHLVAGSDRQLEAPNVQGRKVPTYAYFHAGADTGGQLTGGPLVTGSHSSVDFDFENPIEKMVREINILNPDAPVSMPLCTNIARQYRNELITQ